MNEMKLTPIEATLETAEAYDKFVKNVIAIADKYELDRNRAIKTALIAGVLTAENVNFNVFKGDENEQ